MSELLVVRGATDNSLDPTFACASHSSMRNAYVAIEVDDGNVVDRTLYRSSERVKLERQMNDAKYGSVLVDSRDDKKLLPLNAPSHAGALDIASIHRAKSDSEIHQLTTMGKHLYRAIHGASDSDTFRGAVDAQYDTQNDTQSAFQRHECENCFIEYRGGMRHKNGITVELARVEPLNADWSNRMERVHRGMDAVHNELRVGASIDALNDTFMEHLDREQDVMYGSVMRHTGYNAWDPVPISGSLDKYDVVTLGVTISDTNGNTAHYARGIYDVQ